MRDNEVLKYKLEKFKLGGLIFIGTLLMFVIFGYVTKKISPETMVSINGIDAVVGIFLIVYAITDYFETFKFFQMMNLSRKSYRKGILKSFFIISLLAAIASTIFYIIIPSDQGKQSILEILLFWGGAGKVNIIYNFLWFFLIDIFALLFGTFIGLLYCGANKMKIILVTIILILMANIIPFFIMLFNYEIKVFCSSIFSLMVFLLIIITFLLVTNNFLIQKCKIEG